MDFRLRSPGRYVIKSTSCGECLVDIVGNDLFQLVDDLSTTCIRHILEGANHDTVFKVALMYCDGDYRATNEYIAGLIATLDNVGVVEVITLNVDRY